MNGTAVRFHWTDQPYRWHINDGEEVFAVLDCTVDLRYRVQGAEQVVTLEAGDVFSAPPASRSTATAPAPSHHK
jgi:hypothetical protein